MNMPTSNSERQTNKSETVLKTSKETLQTQSELVSELNNQWQVIKDAIKGCNLETRFGIALLQAQMKSLTQTISANIQSVHDSTLPNLTKKSVITALKAIIVQNGSLISKIRNNITKDNDIQIFTNTVDEYLKNLNNQIQNRELKIRNIETGATRANALQEIEIAKTPREPRNLDNLATKKFTETEKQQIHDKLTAQGRGSSTSRQSTDNIIKYLEIIRSGNLDKLVIQGPPNGEISLNNQVLNGESLYLNTLQKTIRKLTESPYQPNTQKACLERLYQLIFNPDQLHPPTLPKPPERTNNPLEIWARNERLENYENQNYWNGNKLKKTSLTVKELDASSQKLIDRSQTNVWEQSSVEAKGAENAFKNFILKPLLSSNIVSSWTKTIPFSLAESIGGDYIVTISNSTYLFDVKRNQGALESNIQTGNRYRNCHVAPIFKDGELNIKATQQMLKDIIQFSLENL